MFPSDYPIEEGVKAIKPGLRVNSYADFGVDITVAWSD